MCGVSHVHDAALMVFVNELQLDKDPLYCSTWQNITDFERQSKPKLFLFLFYSFFFFFKYNLSMLDETKKCESWHKTKAFPNMFCLALSILTLVWVHIYFILLVELLIYSFCFIPIHITNQQNITDTFRTI